MKDVCVSEGCRLNVLSAKGLTKVYGTKNPGSSKTALNGIDLVVRSSEFVGIMGPSGSGKTTLLNLLAGLDQATSGELWIQDTNMSKCTPEQMAVLRRKSIGFVFQDYNLLDTLTLFENVTLPLALDGQRGKKVNQRAEELLEYLGLRDVMRQYPYEVSGGQQQRTAVARALIHNPALILADEPTGNLDSGSARSLLELLQRLNQENGTSILLVTHDPFSASYCQRIVFIRDGSVFANLEKADSRESFFREILDTLGVLEGTQQ